MSSKVEIIPESVLASMHTGSLISRRRALLKCEESVQSSDRESGYQALSGYIEFKDTDEWKKAYAALKSELSKREHWKGKK